MTDSRAPSSPTHFPPGPTRRALRRPRPPLEASDEYAGRYRVIELVGRGGMGEVYRVHDTVVGVQFALKRVIGGTAGDRAHVIREVRLARQVTHRRLPRLRCRRVEWRLLLPEALTSSMLLVLLYSVLVMVCRRGWAAGAVLTARS